MFGHLSLLCSALWRWFAAGPVQAATKLDQRDRPSLLLFIPAWGLSKVSVAGDKSLIVLKMKERKMPLSND